MKSIRAACQIIALTLSFLILGCGVSKDHEQISLKQAKEIGRKYLESLEDFEDVVFSAAHFYDDPAWKEYVANDSFVANFIKENHLEGKKYWAIHYGQEGVEIGGTAFVFIDSNTGEVIAMFGEE